MIGKEVCKTILFCLNSNRSLETINDKNIILIPKKNISSQVTNFRPISLCHMIYNLVAKVIANRLKRVLPHIISPNQSALVADRRIFDNVVAAYEILHTMNSMKRKRSFMVLKLDMSKAYDRFD
jgi:hypothetical protein